VDDSQRERRFRVLYEAARAPVLAYALRRTASPEDAADVAAETFTIAWRRLEDVPAGDAALLWCYATARRVLANQLRRDRRRSELVDRVGAEVATQLAGGSGSEDPSTGDRQAALVALLRLPDDEREILMLASWEGLDSTQLAEVLGCSRTAARIRLHRARARLAALARDEDATQPAKHAAPSGQSLQRKARNRAPEGA
jgi:RNA polymerase sigma factor (sigma-70 family)